MNFILIQFAHVLSLGESRFKATEHQHVLPHPSLTLTVIPYYKCSYIINYYNVQNNQKSLQYVRVKCILTNYLS